MRIVRLVLTGCGLAAVTALALVVPARAGSGTASGATGASGPHVQKLAITVTAGAAGERVAPANLAIAPDVPVRVTVTNATHEFHTFTIPGLHLSALILPARGAAPRTTTFTFISHRYGVFAWYCAVCLSGTHGHRHMSGKVYAIVNPSVLP